MFNKEALDDLWADLRSKYGNDPDWEQIMRDTHVGVALSDAGVALENIDKRAVEAIEKHRE